MKGFFLCRVPTHFLSTLDQAIKINPKYSKAFYRRATCHLQTLKPREAVKDLKKVLVLEPDNVTVKDQLSMTQKLIRKIDFEKVSCHALQIEK